MNRYRDRPTRLPWPPMLLVAAVAIAYGLGMLHPFPLRFPGSHIVGYVFIAAAIAIDIWAAATLMGARTTVLPHRASSHLVTGGPFAFSRNPIYVAYVVLIAGIGLACGSFWYLLMALAHGVATHFLAIRREENHLLALFGYRYENYCRTVRRWI